MLTRKECMSIALRCLDLTSLNAKDNAEKIKSLCDKAIGKYGAVAAVCVFPQFVQIAKTELDNTDVNVATVVNFPKGITSLTAVVDETKEALDYGADEIDMVFPYYEYVKGDLNIGKDIIAAVKEQCGNKPLKVIIESGVLQKALLISNVTKDCISAGADFVKTSTGMVDVGATPAAANAMIETIRDSGKKVGFKASGGVKTIDDACDYIVIANSIMGPEFLTPKTFRIGASKLMDELIKEMGY